ncbi:uncharacterized protein LOC126829609 isoform X1 [Patella vulgata]|uniref:uncharacterized protein LOC126829609 isoform X1 n=2 Tax=Patella vulgata TaxID=6465 RepID=UPI0024A967D9|nr:uncharacterized protein LOC126829609 isoform X1 [Patella vulgata]
MEEFIKTVMECRKVPGLTLTVVLDKTELSQGYGLSDVKTGRKVDDETLFCIGSLTKSFTTALLADLLVDKTLNIGSCNWDLKLKDILQDFQSADDYRTSEMTLKDILTHRSGLESIDFGIHVGYPTITREQLCRKLKHLKELHLFRDQFSYNNLLYMLAGHVAEVIGNDTWEHLIQTRIFDKYNMVSTGVYEDSLMAKNTAIPYIYDSNEDNLYDVQNLTKMYPADPAGSIFTNSKDMKIWLSHLLSLFDEPSDSEYCHHTTFNKVITASDYGDVFQKYKAPELEVKYHACGYALGWFVSNYKGYEIITHNGDIYGYSSLIVLMPSIKFALYGNTNGPGGEEGIIALHQIAYYMLDVFALHETPATNMSTACAHPMAFPYNYTDVLVDKSGHGILNPERYTGIYGHPIIGELTIVYLKDEDILMCSMGYKFKGYMLKGNDNMFFISPDGVIKYLYEIRGGQVGLFFDNTTMTKDGLFENVTLQFSISGYEFSRRIRFSTEVINSSSSLTDVSWVFLVLFVVFYNVFDKN